MIPAVNPVYTGVKNTSFQGIRKKKYEDLYPPLPKRLPFGEAVFERTKKAFSDARYVILGVFILYGLHKKHAALHSRTSKNLFRQMRLTMSRPMD